MILLTHPRTASVKLTTLIRISVREQLINASGEDSWVLNLGEFFEFPVEFCMGQINKLAVHPDKVSFPQTVEVFSLHENLDKDFFNTIVTLRHLLKEKSSRYKDEVTNLQTTSNIFIKSPEGRSMYFLCQGKKITFNNKTEVFNWLALEHKRRIRFINLVNASKNFRIVCKVHIAAGTGELGDMLSGIYKYMVDKMPCHFLYRKDQRAALQSALIKNQKLYSKAHITTTNEPVKRNFDKVPLTAISSDVKIDPMEANVWAHTGELINLLSLMTYALKKYPEYPVSCYEEVYFENKPYNFIFHDFQHNNEQVQIYIKDLEQKQRELNLKVENPLVYESSKDDYFTDSEIFSKSLTRRITLENNSLCDPKDLMDLLKKLKIKI